MGSVNIKSSVPPNSKTGVGWAKHHPEKRVIRTVQNLAPLTLIAFGPIFLDKNRKEVVKPVYFL